MQIVIDITEKDLRIAKGLVKSGLATGSDVAIMNGTPLPKGHGRLIDADEVIKIANKNKDLHGAIWNATTIIEPDKKYEAKVITRGNCMMCGKKLDEGLFFCKECEAKAESEG